MTRFEKISEKQFLIDFNAYSDSDYAKIELPKRATSGSAGYDFFAPFSFDLDCGESIKIPTGIRILMPKDKVLLIMPRSSLGFKYRIQLDNTVGVIDSDYNNSPNEGHIWIKLTNDSKQAKKLHVNCGEAFAQGIILKFELTDDDCTDGIRNGGFGSTNKASD